MKFLILSFEDSAEQVLHDIIKITKKQQENEIRNVFITDEVLYRGDLVINPVCRTLEKNGEYIYLTAYEFDILYLLAKKPGWVYSRERIYNLIWSEPYNFNEWSVIHTIGHLRRKIGDNAIRPHYIITIRGNGYKFNPILKNQMGK